MGQKICILPSIFMGHTITTQPVATGNFCLHCKELEKIQKLSKESGFSIVPTRLLINDRGLAKLVIAVAKGKKIYDKRESIKEREDKRQMDRAFKR